MAIKTIDDIYIDGKNRAWGGYIYSLSYDPNFGESPSEVVVEVTNESGVFDIDKEDLRVTGSPVVIKIGTKITFYGYPMDYQIEDSPSGKTLRVSYWDESVPYLDRKVVKLKTRGLITENYENTIVVGVERVRNQPITSTVSASVFANITGVDLRLQVTDVDYTFPDLLTKISSFVATQPILDAAAQAFRRDYSGRLREVLSAWCNDLGLGFYWEDRRLNFIDLKNPANLSAVEAYASSIRNANNIQSRSYGYSLKDTFTKGTEIFFGKDGEILQEASDKNKTTRYSFNNIRIKNIPGTPTLYSANGIWQGETEALFLKRVKAAYYGVPSFLLSLIRDRPTAGSSLAGVCDAVEITANTSLVSQVSANTGFYTRRADCRWWAVRMNPEENKGFEQLFNAYYAYAQFYGRFFWKKLPTVERAQSIFGQEGKFYDEWIGIKDVDIFKQYLEPLVKFIPDYDTLSLRGWIEQTGDKTTVAPSGPFEAPREGFFIMETQPEWKPKDNDYALDLGQYIIIEGSDSDTNYYDEVSVTIDGQSKTVRVPIFYFGKIDKRDIPDTTTIVLPKEDPRVFSAQNTGNIAFSSSISPKIEYTTYTPPPTGNVNFYDFSSDGLGEEQVLGVSAFYFKQLLATRAAFDLAAANVISSTNRSQMEPFYSDSLTVPNIDLAGGVKISASMGLVSMSVSIGANGVQTLYRFGTENMKLRNSDVFYRYYYDSAKKKLEQRPVSNIVIRLGAAREGFSKK